MQFAKCKWCGKHFQSYGHHICPDCIRSMESQYDVVKEFLYENPNASIEEVVEATGVQEKVILYFLREGRLEMSRASGLLRCQQCGAPMSSGKLCEKCMKKLDARMIQPIQAKQERERRARADAAFASDPSRRGMHTR